MLFKVNTKENKLEAIRKTWKVTELELERYILTTQDNNKLISQQGVFNEELLIINNQVRTRDNKRADLLAIDKMGNAVIIELKRDEGSLGVETQALQYLADFSRYKGSRFLEQFAKTQDKKEDILGFVGDNCEEKDLNSSSRIILIAQNFDTTLYSMGEWLCSKGVGFKCIQYIPLDVNGERFIEFAQCFEKSPNSIYPIEFALTSRSPKILWHNVGYPDNQWWSHLNTNKIITASFDNSRDDAGEKLLKNYIPGDRIVAYAAQRGAIGWGIVQEDPYSSYKLIDKGHEDDLKSGSHLHRISISWQDVAPTTEQAITATQIREQFQLHHPVSTSTGMSQENGERLIAEMAARWSKAN